jgi:hypothetical protein
MATEFRRRYPPNPDDPTGVAAVLRGGPPELYPEVPAELIEKLVERLQTGLHVFIGREKSAAVMEAVRQSLKGQP